LAGFIWPQASLPRTTKNKPTHHCTPIIDGKKIFSRTLKCYLQQSWYRDPEDSRNNPMVRGRKRQANREPSLVVDRGHISWLMLLGIHSSNKAKAACLAKTSSKPTSLAFLVGTAVLPRCSQNFLGDEREMGPQETTCKIKILLYWHLRMPLETFPQWTF
jgi:hypothetical protein